jgi:hypothetical protein
MNNKLSILFAGLALLSFTAEVSVAELPAGVRGFLENNCLACHNADTQEGDIRLDAFSELGSQEQIELLNRIEEQVTLGQMPPEDEDQPTDQERQAFVTWIDSQYLALNIKSQFKDKLRFPSYGNYVNHEKLFSGEIKDKAYSPARRWLVSPKIFMSRVNGVFQLEGGNRRETFLGVTQPFLLPAESGVRYYDNQGLSRGHLLVMLKNAEWIAGKQLWRWSKDIDHQNKFDNLRPHHIPIPEAFCTIAEKQSKPTEQEMVDAINVQFDNVLRRGPTDHEFKEYLSLFQSLLQQSQSVSTADANAIALRKVLVSVLLETEFLYRLEFGAGEEDAFARKKLSPREASYAISYALSDLAPDDQLRQTGEEGRLLTKADYRREVLRLLNDKKRYFGESSPVNRSKNWRSHSVTHPKVNRFFREFFGYAKAGSIFKDTPRFHGVFTNFDKSGAGTGGLFIDEADKVIDHILKEDKNVFTELLTTDEYFVYHKYSNEKSQQIIDDWKTLYTLAKNKNWEANPEKFIEDHFQDHKKLFLNIRIMKITERDAKRIESLKIQNLGWLKKHMTYFDHTFGKGITPFSVIRSHGNRWGHSSAYNLPHAFGQIGMEREQDNWDYPVQQPFKVPNRMGILTHPAWLMAHASNTHTDPVVRGKWIREKLLAGRVSDVPITVDAKIPDDHDKTIRERFSVTEQQACWKCHVKMNPLGYAFENFDDFGRYRTVEELEHPENLLTKAHTRGPTFAVATYKTKALNTRGVLSGTGDKNLDGEVKDSFDLIGRLAKSDRVRQSIIRHAFRYFMGRNEMLSDSQTLIDADNAYVKSGGSFKAVIVSLLTSDSFMYRK